MPRQTTRRPPLGMGRFTYWYFDVSYPICVPEVRRAALPQSIQASLGAHHDEIAANFRAIRDGAESPGLLKDLQAAFRPESNRQVLALRYYIELDRLWQQDQAAWELLQELPSREREELLALDKKTWGRPQSWRWETLLPTIAKDQKIFREIVFRGPTDAGLVGTRKGGKKEVESVLDRHGVSEATARRIYRYYQRQMSDLMGLGVLAPAGWRRGLQKAGLLNAQGRLPTKPILRILEGLPRNERKRHTEPIFHWFHHALRNLVRYRDGHPPLPFDAYACARDCRAAQQRLLS